MTDQPKPSDSAKSCGERAPFIPRWGLSYQCVLVAGHGGDHSAGAVSWSNAPHAAAAPLVSTTIAVGTPVEADDSVRWLRYNAKRDPHYFRLCAIADELERSRAEVARLRTEIDALDNDVQKEGEALAAATQQCAKATAALADLSFACFGGIGTRAPDVDTYNRTFAVLEALRSAVNL